MNLNTNVIENDFYFHFYVGVETFFTLARFLILSDYTNFTKNFSFKSSLLQTLQLYTLTDINTSRNTHIMSHSTTQRNSTESKALQLLGNGYGPGVVASACGVSESRISQLLSEPEFAAEVSELRFKNLQKHNELDAKYDSMEEQLVDQLKDLLPLMMRPMEILKAISVINAAKRRGSSAPEQITHQNAVVNLVIPTTIMQKFTVNINNQVIQAGSQTLETIQSNTLLNNSKVKNASTAIETISSTPATPATPAKLLSSNVKDCDDGTTPTSTIAQTAPSSGS